jgi:hypothetical protein
MFHLIRQTDIIQLTHHRLFLRASPLATVLQLPVQPTTAAEEEAQKRVAYSGYVCLRCEGAKVSRPLPGSGLFFDVDKGKAPRTKAAG